MQTTRIASLLLTGWLATLAPLASAVDPSLHDPAVLWVDSAGPVAATMPPPPTVVETVEVSDIEELDAMPAAAAAAPGDLWERMRNGFAMPDLQGRLVDQRVRWYAERPELLQAIVERSRLYLFHIVDALEKRGMPTELALLPMVESAFNPLAYSRAHASGLWQFIPSTALNHKLEQNWWYDERRDIVASTNAALDYLASLHDMFGDWHLALAAYNWGENGVQRAIDRNRTKRRSTDYQSLRMPNETRYYVPSFQALKNIIARPAAFGIDLQPIPNARYFVTVTLTRDIDLDVAARLAEMPVDELMALNPGHNRPIVASELSPQLILPADRADTFAANLETHDKPLTSWQIYTFKPGDKLERLAQQHGASVARLKAINGIRPNGKPVPGQQLLLPEKGTAVAAEALPPLFTPPPSALGRVASYVVRAGDAWASIAKAFNVKIADLKRWNQEASLVPGERLVIQIPLQKGKGVARRAGRPKVKQAAKPTPARQSAPAAPTRQAAPAAKTRWSAS